MRDINDQNTKNRSKKRFKEIWSWLLERIETDDERVLKIARKKIEKLKIICD